MDDSSDVGRAGSGENRGCDILRSQRSKGSSRSPAGTVPHTSSRYPRDSAAYVVKICFLDVDMTARITRSRSRQASQDTDPPVAREVPSPLRLVLKGTSLQESKVDALPLNLEGHRHGLCAAELGLMLTKATKLTSTAFQESLQSSDVAQAAAATLVFAQYEAGTAVCISPHGLLLTCAHCVHDAEDAASGVGEERWLLFASGRIVQAHCIAWDTERDLALLKIIAARPAPANASTDGGQPSHSALFPSITVSTTLPRSNTSLSCIGHPGSEDLEASTSGIATDYDVLHISSGRFRGLAKGQDPQDNSEIGALKHDCWTYWGHSGAPLVDREGRLVGLHSSWDDETGMRRGVPLQAVRAFLGEWVHERELWLQCRRFDSVGLR